MITSLDERLKRMKKLSLISEATYSLVDGIDEDDALPNDIYEEPAPLTNNDSSIGEEEEEAAPEPEVDEAPPEGGVESDMVPDEAGTEEPEVAPEQPQRSEDEVQNDILKLNVAALEKMQQVMDSLETTVDSLNGRVEQLGSEIQELDSDVEEVREPTNVEKLESRKEDSHPYYYNLNNMWNGNSFQARMDQAGDQGIIQLEDGTYQANFDDLPSHSEQEIKASFKKY